MVSHYTRRSNVPYDYSSYGHIHITCSEVMKQIHAYLNPESEQGIEDMRITHLLKTLDIMENEIRIYIQEKIFRKLHFTHTTKSLLLPLTVRENHLIMHGKKS